MFLAKLFRSCHVPALILVFGVFLSGTVFAQTNQPQPESQSQQPQPSRQVVVDSIQALIQQGVYKEQLF